MYLLPPDTLRAEYCILLCLSRRRNIYLKVIELRYKRIHGNYNVNKGKSSTSTSTERRHQPSNSARWASSPTAKIGGKHPANETG